jgi:hypothetical protein
MSLIRSFHLHSTSIEALVHVQKALLPISFPPIFRRVTAEPIQKRRHQQSLERIMRGLVPLAGRRGRVALGWSRIQPRVSNGSGGIGDENSEDQVCTKARGGRE